MAEGRDITAEVKRIIKEQLDVDEKDIKPEASFIDDLGADSLGLVELVLAFEEAFEIDIPDEDTEKIRSVQDAITYIEAHSKKWPDQSPCEAPAPAPAGAGRVSLVKRGQQSPALTEEPPPMQRVVITGIGLVTPNGIGTEETWRSVLAAESGIGPITLFDAATFSTRFAGEVKGFDPERWMPKKKIKEMGRFAQLAVAASTICLQDAAIELTDADRDMCGTFIGVGIGGLEFLYAHSVTLREKGPSKLTPYLIPHVIANLAAGQVAMALNLRGASYCNTSACSSSGHSLGEAFEWIRRGRTAIMLAGGAESTVTGLGIGGFGAMFALSRRNEEPARASRPWDRGRDGFVCSEGAGSLLLESLPHAKARGAKIYGEIVGYGASCDAYHITKPSPNGEGAYRAMRMALEDATPRPRGRRLRERPRHLDAAGRHRGDARPHPHVRRPRPEQEALGELDQVGDGPPPRRRRRRRGRALLPSPCATACVPPTANLEDQDPECPLDYVPLKARERKVKHVMTNSFGFGGTNVSLVLSFAL